MMVSEHAHGTFLVTLEGPEVDALTAMIEDQEVTEERSPCVMAIVEILLPVFSSAESAEALEASAP